MKTGQPGEDPRNCSTASCPFNDFLTLLFLLGFPFIIVLFRENLGYWYLFVTGHYILSIPVIRLFRQRRCERTTTVFLRAWYPFIQAVAAYKLMGFMIFLVKREWADPLFIHLEEALFGFQPSLELAKAGKRLTHEIMHLAYFSYLCYVPYFGMVLYLRKHLREFRNFMAGRFDLVDRFTYFLTENQFLREKIRESIDQVESPRDKLKSYILTKMKYTKELANIPNILSKDDYLEYLPFMEVARRKNYEEEIRIVKEILQLGIGEGIFRIEDLNLTALVVVSFLKGLEISWNIEWMPFDLKREVDVFLHILFGGISLIPPASALDKAKPLHRNMGEEPV